MTTTKDRLKHRRWADIVVIVASVYLLLAAAWAPLELVSGGGAWEVQNPVGLMAAYAIAGTVGLAGLFLTTRSTMMGRALVVIGGIISLGGLFTLAHITVFALISLGVPGAAMMLIGPIAGQMPTPEQEGKPRGGLGS